MCKDELEPSDWDIYEDGLWLGDQKPAKHDKDFFDKLMEEMDKKFKEVLENA